jgi:hypothetical protein
MQHRLKPMGGHVGLPAVERMGKNLICSGELLSVDSLILPIQAITSVDQVAHHRRVSISPATIIRSGACPCPP